MSMNVTRQASKNLARIISCPNCYSSRILVAWTVTRGRYLMKGYCCSCRQNWTENDDGGDTL